MYRIIGAVLVIVSCSAMGIYEGLELIKHEDVMKQIRQMVILLKGEIRYGNSSLFDIFQSISVKVSGVTGEFLSHLSMEMKKADKQQFYELFEKCARKTGICVRMRLEEKTRFLEFGKILGASDRETQLMQLDIYLQELAGELSVLHEEIQEKKKLYRNLGIMAGMFLVILLW